MLFLYLSQNATWDKVILYTFWVWWGLFEPQSPVSQPQLEIKLDNIRFSNLGIMLGSGVRLWKFRVTLSKILTEMLPTYHLVLDVLVGTWYNFSQTTWQVYQLLCPGKRHFPRGEFRVELWDFDSPKIFWNSVKWQLSLCPSRITWYIMPNSWKLSQQLYGWDEVPGQ